MQLQKKAIGMIILQPFAEEDFERLIQWIPTAEFLMLWSGPYFDFPLDNAQLISYIESAKQVPPPRLIYKAVDDSSGVVIGHIELNHIDRKNLSGVVSKVLIGNTNERGKGIGTEIVNLLIEVAFKEIHLHRLSLYVFDFNTRAIECYKKSGFHIEGHLKDFRRVGDKYLSSYLMALLDQDWRSKSS